MRVPKIVCGVLAGAVFLHAQAVHLRGVVKDAQAQVISSAVVSFQDGNGFYPLLRTHSDALGVFDLTAATGGIPSPVLQNSANSGLHGGAAKLEILSIVGAHVKDFALTAQAGAQALALPGSLFQAQIPGVYVVRVSQSGHQVAVGTVHYAGGNSTQKLNLQVGATRVLAKTAADRELVVRKAGYLPWSVDLAAGTDVDLGTITLVRDPIEAEIDVIIGQMSTEQKIGQMTQALVGDISYATVKSAFLGSVLSGGGDAIPVYNTYQTQAMSVTPAVPFIYGVDAVHGNNKVTGSVIFPHNIGLGATRDSALVRRVGEVTAKEVLATGVDFDFAPCIAVSRDERWGRAYESFGETPELAVSLGSAFIRGLQGSHFDAPWRVIGSAKHFLADGGTAYGSSGQSSQGGLLDQGDSKIDEATVRSIHLPGYIAAVDAGVLSIMASYSSINGVKMHGNKYWLTDVLKTELGFEGFVISDYNAIAQINPNYNTAVATAINAGVDMGMEANDAWSGALGYSGFIAALKTAVTNGTVPMSRIDDAVRRILRSKIRAGRFDHPQSITDYNSELGSAEHRAVGREAVAKSVVVLKNDASTLPLATGKNYTVMGLNADNMGRQCGGWTLSWQGSAAVSTTGTTILQGLVEVGGAGVKLGSSVSATDDAVVVVMGETLPYAEFEGDRTATQLALTASDVANVTAAYNAGKKVIGVIVSGRPLVIAPETLAKLSALVAVWYPGTEAGGVADVLFGVTKPSGLLPVSWPATASQIPINVGDAGYENSNAPLYPYGFGLSY